MTRLTILNCFLVLLLSGCASTPIDPIQFIPGTWTVREVRGLSGYTFEGTTAFTFTLIDDNPNYGQFVVEGNDNLPQVLQAGIAVPFPDQGEYGLESLEGGLRYMRLGDVIMEILGVTEGQFQLEFNAYYPEEETEISVYLDLRR